jgi:hypothetical protein
MMQRRTSSLFLTLFAAVCAATIAFARDAVLDPLASQLRRSAIRSN